MSIDTKELRAIVERVTPGEWRVYRHPQSPDNIGCDIVGQTRDHDIAENVAPENAVGIVALKNAAPEMLAEIERLREALERISKSTGCVDACPCWAKLRRQARAAMGGEA